MASCFSFTLSGIPSSCDASKGGIQEVYIAPYEFVDEVTVSEETGKVTAITMASGKKFNHYQFKKNTGSLTSTLTKDDTVGVSYYTNEVSLVFPRMDAAKRTEVASLALGELAIIVKDANDKLWYVTYGGYASATATTGNSGTNVSDGSNYSLTLSSETTGLPYEVDEDIVKTLVTYNS